MTLICIWWWGFIPGDLGSVEYLFITPRFILNQSCCIYSGPIYGSNRSVWKIIPIQSEYLMPYYCIHLSLFLILIYLDRFSGLLSATSLVGLRFILVSLSISLLTNGHKNLFDFFMSLFTQIPHVNHRAGEIAILGVSSLRHPGLTLSLWLILMTEPTRELLKMSARGSSLVYHFTGCFPLLLF